MAIDRLRPPTLCYQLHWNVYVKINIWTILNSSQVYKIEANRFNLIVDLSIFVQYHKITNFNEFRKMGNIFIFQDTCICDKKNV